MRALAVARKDLLIIFRDRKALFVILAMPLVLVFILGAALAPMFSQSESIGPFRIAVVDLDRGEISSLLIDVFESEGLRSFITVEPASSEDVARDLVRQRSVTCAVVIPHGLSDSTQVSPNKIIVMGDPGEPIRTQIVQAIVSSFAEQYSVVVAGTVGVMGELMKATGPIPNAADMVKSVVADLSTRTTVAAGMFTKVEEDAGWITALQYYSAAMTAMFVLYGSLTGTKSILDEKQEGTMARLFTTRAIPRDIIAGKCLSTFVLSFTQVLIMVLVTKYAFKVSWGPSFLPVLAVSAALAFAATGFAMLIAAISKTERMADAIENFGVQIMAFLGGCQLPIYIFPQAMQSLSKLTLTRWGLEGYLALMNGQGSSTALTPIAVLGCIGLVFLSAGVMRLRLD